MKRPGFDLGEALQRGFEEILDLRRIGATRCVARTDLGIRLQIDESVEKCHRSLDADTALEGAIKRGRKIEPDFDIGRDCPQQPSAYSSADSVDVLRTLLRLCDSDTESAGE
jgi:hypothetical protein